MTNSNKIHFRDIKNYLLKNNLKLTSEISDNDFFYKINSIENSNKDDLTFFMNTNSLKNLIKTKAKACIISVNNIKHLPTNTSPIIVKDVYRAFALTTHLFKSDKPSNGIISNNSIINNSTKLSDNIQIDHFVNILDNCIINKNVIIESNCTIGPNVIIGENSVIKSNTRLLNCNIGSNCLIKSGAVIGGTGFGFDPLYKTRITHFGNVIIKNNCSIGSNTTIDRAVFDSTVISENSFIDNQVQIAHNVFIGKGAIIAAQSGIAGSTIVGDDVVIGGQSGISGHLVIGNNVKLAARSGITKNISHNSVVAGFPAIDIKKWKIANIKFKKL